MKVDNWVESVSACMIDSPQQLQTAGEMSREYQFPTGDQ